MAERVLSPRVYLGVLVLLLLLTVLTVSVSFVPMGGFWHIVCGLLIALVKAGLVVLFFMQALVEPACQLGCDRGRYFLDHHPVFVDPVRLLHPWAGAVHAGALTLKPTGWQPVGYSNPRAAARGLLQDSQL